MAIAEDRHADHQARARRAGNVSPRRRRPRRSGGSGRPAEPVGVHARGRAAPGAGEHGLDRQSARDVLETFKGSARAEGPEFQRGSGWNGGGMKPAMAWALGGFVHVASPQPRAQQSIRTAPTAADWASLARLPDFTGVWELSFGGPPPRLRAGGTGGLAAAGWPGGTRRCRCCAAARGRGRGFAAGPSLTPEYAAKKKAFDANPPEDSETANCLCRPACRASWASPIRWNSCSRPAR